MAHALHVTPQMMLVQKECLANQSDRTTLICMYRLRDGKLQVYALWVEMRPFQDFPDPNYWIMYAFGREDHQIVKDTATIFGSTGEVHSYINARVRTQEKKGYTNCCASSEASHPQRHWESVAARIAPSDPQSLNAPYPGWRLLLAELPRKPETPSSSAPSPPPRICTLTRARRSLE